MARPAHAVPGDPRWRAGLLQLFVLAAVVGLVAFFVHNALVNMARAGIATGWGFLQRQASFDIGESLIRYSSSDTYARAFLVGVLNTLFVSALAILFSTVLGTAVGVARLSRNWLLAKLALAYVEGLRNVPLLLQLIVWWDVLRQSAPLPRAAWQPLPGVFVSVRGVVFPVPHWSPVYGFMGLALAAGLLAAIAYRVLLRRRRAAPRGAVLAALALGPPILVFIAGGAPLALSWPHLQAFNFSGGVSLSPEFTAVLLGLSVYTAAFIAEIVRGGILGVPRGQGEAALALGLHERQVLRLVILPQALRIIVPPMLSEYLALIKNSSLAIAIGYPELMSVTNTTLNQTGQAIEAISLMMAIYLAISLTTSLAMNWYNRRITLAGR